jgi:LmbE family N-acetylglucosaminyl deacetylase
MSLACLESEISSERWDAALYSSTVSRFYASVHNRDQFSPEVVTTKGREELYAITDPSRLDNDTIAFVWEAHPDDSAMGEGTPESLAENGITVIYGSITHGGARDLAHVTKEELIAIRRNESIDSATHSGAGAVAHFGYPDGLLSHYTDDATRSLRIMVSRIAGKKRILFLAPHSADGHPDHVAANTIASTLAQEFNAPFYATDTISGTNEQTMNGEALHPSHYIPLSSGILVRRNEAFRIHRSQNENLPTEAERQAVSNVIAMPNRRGWEIGVPHAAALFHDPRSGPDILGDIVPDVISMRKRNPTIIFTRDKK